MIDMWPQGDFSMLHSTPSMLQYLYKKKIILETLTKELVENTVYILHL